MKNTQQLRLVIRADAYRAIGVGHVMRSVALAQAWMASGGKVLFVSYCESDFLRSRLGVEEFSFIPIPKPYPHPSDMDATTALLDNICANEEREKTLIVLDGYHFDGYYQKTIKNKGFRLLCIDDYGHADQYYADIILNQNLDANISLYSKCPLHTRFLLSSRYMLLRREFLKWKTWKRDIPAIAKRVLVTMGGADQDNVTLKVLDVLKEVAIPHMEVAVLLGPANPHKYQVEHALSLLPFGWHLLSAVDNMPEIMTWADIAISAGGSTSWELAFMGLPSLLLVIAENQRTVSQKLDEAGVSLNLGWHDKATISTIVRAVEGLMKNQKMRKSMSIKGRSLVDGSGGLEVVKALKNSYVTFRQVREEDCRFVWEWANDPDIRAVSFSTDPINWENHVHWFTENINDDAQSFYILLDSDNEPVGQVRFAKNGKEAVISVSIGQKFRGKGYGTQGIRFTSEELFRVTEISSIRAYIKPENSKSVRAFTRAGFHQELKRDTEDESNQGLMFVLHREKMF